MTRLLPSSSSATASSSSSITRGASWSAWFAVGALAGAGAALATWQSGRLTSPGISRCQGRAAEPPSADAAAEAGLPSRRSGGGLEGRGGDTPGGPETEPGRSWKGCDQGHKSGKYQKGHRIDKMIIHRNHVVST